MVLIPRVGHEVTTEWLQKILLEYERKSNPNCTLSVTEFNVQSGSVVGDGFNSDLSIVNAKAKFKITGDSEDDDKKYNLYMKFHSLNVFVREINMYNKSHLKEMLLYSNIFSELTLLQENEAKGMPPLRIPTSYYSYNKRDDYVLVLENLLHRGYKVNDKTKGLSFNHLELAIKELARLHALSYVFNKRTNFLKHYPQFNLPEKYFKFFLPILEAGVTNLVPLLDHDITYKKMLPKISNPSAIMQEFINQSLDKDPSKIQCLLHGDFWNNNLMYKYDESSLPCDIKIIDWQMSYWGRPVMDIHKFLYSSTTHTVRENHSSHLLQLYYETFQDITVTLKCPHPGYTFEAFTKEFMEAKVVGLVLGITFAQTMLGQSIKNMNAVQTISPRSFGYKFKCWLMRLIIPAMTQTSLNFLTKPLAKKILRPVGEEIKGGQNTILNERLLGLVIEANQLEYFN